MNSRSFRVHFFTVSASLVAWFGILLQFILSLRLSIANGNGLTEGVVIYFGFFTIITNIFVAFTLLLPSISSTSLLGRFFARPGVSSAAAASITVVGIAYFLLLRNVWDPQGWQLIADIVLHYVTPILFLIYWWFAVPKETLKWSSIPIWTLYPIGYAGYAFVRGAITGLYPYHFIDVCALGYLSAFTNASMILFGFVLTAAILVAVAKLKNPKS